MPSCPAILGTNGSNYPCSIGLVRVAIREQWSASCGPFQSAHFVEVKVPLIDSLPPCNCPRIEASDHTAVKL